MGKNEIAVLKCEVSVVVVKEEETVWWLNSSIVVAPIVNGLVFVHGSLQEATCLKT